jgi:Rne/Rng family ribonuclease
MAKEICISSTPHETRLAVLEDDQLAEIYYERENEYTLAGSIYNGRVTRVLPGMQSAFVDVGLERDAFLYVTDFLELEDQEETDELEKAAVSGGAQPPREVRHDRSGQKTEPRQEARPAQERVEKPSKTGQIVVETAPESDAAALKPASDFQQSAEDSGEPGAKRWRGRRRRRGGRGSRGGAIAPERQPESGEASTASLEVPQETSPEVAPEIHAAAAPERTPRGERAAAPSAPPFVLPGESLSKYGGAPATDAERPAAAPIAPARPSSSFKPTTLIETPLAWDGSGLLPGESLSRLHNRQDKTAAPEQQAAPGAVEENSFFEETTEALPEIFPDPAVNMLAGQKIAPAAEEDELAEEEAIEEEDTPETAEPEDDAVASHNVDPLPPAGFRLFGLGGKKKDAKSAAKPASASSYAPGKGLIEEEIIEEEEFEAPRRHRRGKAEEPDLDSFEEETLPTQARSGDLGEMLQEAHLDHRMDLKFDEKSGEEEEGEEPSSESQPAAPPQQRRDRSARGGRRGRGNAPAAAPAGNRGARGRGPSRRSAQLSDLPIISDLLKPGQEILVQIAKEPIAKKGARITSHIALPGRFLVFMPTVNHIGVSRKIASDEERQRLKRILVHERGEASGGFIVRTAAEGASEEELRADLRMLLNLWADIKKRSDESKSPALIYHDLSLIERILRDQISTDFEAIWVDTEDAYERIVRFLNHFSPSLVRRVKLYTKETPLFEQFGVEDEISKALCAKVWLKSGGSIVINQTEALVAIDVNTGKYVGKSARLEDTIVKTNLDAVPEIVRQIRLRDLGGIIIIDFIDMDDRKNRFKVMAALEEALKSDRAPTKVLQFNDFGLVAITRKRVKQSLERTLSVPCPVCQATGMVKSPTTVCNEIYVELRKMRKTFEGEDVVLRVNPETVKVLKSNDGSRLTEFEELVGKSILVKSDPTLHPEQFDIQG